MTDYVIDASVILSFLTKNNHPVNKLFPSLLRNQQQGKIKLLSPIFLDLEVANGLRFSIKNHPKAGNYLNQYFNLPIKKVRLTIQTLEKILSAAYQNSTTVYDTAYHVLAISRNATFLTCDQDYYKKTKHLGYIKLIR